MPAKKKKQLDSAGMVAALAPTTSENYLGDPQVVDFLLRNYANTCLQRRAQILADVEGDSPEWNVKTLESAQADCDDARPLADVFLGKNKIFTTIAGFNRPGVIDRWLVDELHVEGDSPEEVVYRAVVTFLMAFYKVANIIADTPENEDTDEANQMMIDNLMQNFTKLLMGIPEWNKA